MAETLMRVHIHTQCDLINEKEISIEEKYALFEIYKTDQLM